MFRKILLSAFTILILQLGLFADSLIKPCSCLTLQRCLDIAGEMNPQIIKAREEVLANRS
jgi:hypothetical protein